MLADVSGSMAGEPIQALWKLFEDVICLLMHDPYALETGYVSLITYSFNVEMSPFCELASFELPQLPKIKSGPKNCGLALMKFLESYKEEFKIDSPTGRSDWPPLVFLGTCGAPSDIAIFNQAVKDIKSLNFQQIYIYHGNDKKKNYYLPLSNNIFSLYNYSDDLLFTTRHLWVGETIECPIQECSEELPPPPPGINIII